MKITSFILLAFLVITNCYSQDPVDIGTPESSPFQPGGDVQGSIQNSVNQATGKVFLSIPISSISSGSVSYGLGINYDSQSAFKTAKEQNLYNPTSTAGVGWTLSTPKIVVDNKQTATQDDDIFYLIDGTTSSKLICVNKEEYYWEFQLEKFAPWKITYHLGYPEVIQSGGGRSYTVFRELDYWSIIKEDGLTYNYGYTTNAQQNNDVPLSASNSKENVVAWGNWIGDSKQANGVKKTIAWNISRIIDQWGNKLDFEYELQESFQSGATKQTEASYLKKITSSKGASIQLAYNFKNINEYHEPHTEISEPDAYQERYEKKYLNSISVYNNSNQFINSYNLGYFLNGSGQNMKRYLGTITEVNYNNNQAYSLPSQQFEYYTSGVFQGGLKKVTYPAGGSVTYNYQNKPLFTNSPNRNLTYPDVAGHVFYSAFVSDNYNLYVTRTLNPVSGNKHQFRIYRVWWSGDGWERHEFIFPHLIEDAYPNNGERLKDFSAVLENNAYGFLFDKGTTADLYMFHLNKDGRTWKEQINTNLYVGDGSEPPVLMSGDDFIAVGSRHIGRIDGFVWNGTSWNAGIPITQGAGHYYYAATNNFILSLNKNGGSDMITGTSHQDNYYIHYLDAEKKWRTKSWSAAADPHIGGIQSRSQFYPSNSMTGIVAADNPELFLRWDTNYNLIGVDNVLGSYNDEFPIQPIANSMFTLHSSFYGMPLKSARFNGVNWNVSSLPSSSNYYAKLNFGEDMLFFQDHDMYTSFATGYHWYDPNYNSWNYNMLNGTGSIANSMANGINKEFVIAGNKIYKKSTQGVPTLLFNQIGSLQYHNHFTRTDGLSHAFVKESENINGGIYFRKSTFFYINKEDGLLSSINLGLQDVLRGTLKIGGYNPFMSPSSLWVQQPTSSSTFNGYLYRVIDDKFNNTIYDIVVDNIELDDDNGGVRKLQYVYNSPKPTSDNSVVYYGEVVVENKGFGASTIGKVKTIFNNGSTDLHMAGLPLEVHTFDKYNNFKQKTIKSWEKLHKSNSGIDLGYYLTLSSTAEMLYFDGQLVESQSNNTYNSNGQLSATSKTNSKGQVESQEIKYAYEQYPFVKDKNILKHVYESKTKLDGQVVDVARANWVNVNGKAYIKENWSGPNESQIRLNTDISVVDANGNILENHDGKGIYNSILNGYDNNYEVATITNAKHQDVLNQLDVTYAQLKELSTTNLKIELMKLYDRLPKAMISLTFYDDNGRVISRVNERREESFVYYDNYGRLHYITDAQGKVLELKEYNFGN